MLALIITMIIIGKHKFSVNIILKETRSNGLLNTMYGIPLRKNKIKDSDLKN